MPGELWSLLGTEERPVWLGHRTRGTGIGEETGEIATGKATGGLDGHSKDLGFCPKSKGKSWKCVLCIEMLKSDM